MSVPPTTLLITFTRTFSDLSEFFWYVITHRRLDVDVKYYADGEDGIKMEQDLVALAKELGMKPFKGETKEEKETKETKETSSAETKQEPSASSTASKNKKNKNKNKKKK